MIRIKNMSENDELMIEYISKNVGVNVHYIPMPMLTIFQNLAMI